MTEPKQAHLDLMEQVVARVRTEPSGESFINKGIFLSLRETFEKKLVLASEENGLEIEVSDWVQGIKITWRPKVNPADGFVTVLGCTIKLTEPPEHFGEGSLLQLSVDTRRAEVYLSPADEEMLLTILTSRKNRR